ncbi:nuclear transport factor 2 family protein [Undibacterium arcticum]
MADAIHVFEPREFIEAGEHVTVLGWEQSTALDSGEDFASEWAHVFTVKGGKNHPLARFFSTLQRAMGCSTGCPPANPGAASLDRPCSLIWRARLNIHLSLASRRVQCTRRQADTS